jgi:hypothetical protein
MERPSFHPKTRLSGEISRYIAQSSKRYLASKRHTIEVDFLAHLREIERERGHGARRVNRRPG